MLPLGNHILSIYITSKTWISRKTKISA